MRRCFTDLLGGMAFVGAACAVVLAVATLGCRAVDARADTLARHEFSRFAMGGEARIVLHAPSEAIAVRAAEAAFAEIARVEAHLSDWRADSELARLPARAAHGPVEVSPVLFDALSRALDVARRSRGAFDPTIGPLVAPWRAARRAGRLPDPNEIEAARARVGWWHVTCTSDGHVSVDRADLELDLGALGKGFACARALDVLRAAGVASALVQMGGDLACSAPPPGRAGWSIDLAPEPGASVGERLVLADRALSTSGDREQHVEIGGVTYSHVVHPVTGRGLTSRAQVFVVAADAAAADAWSTALGVAWEPLPGEPDDAGGRARVAALVARAPGIEAAIVDGRDRALRFASGGWSRIPRENPTRP